MVLALPFSALGAATLSLAILFAGFLGWLSAQAVLRRTAERDPSRIVIDELVGQWIALLPVISSEAEWPAWIAAFVLFRLFDILKPWPVSWADRQPGAFGVMIDDVLAGALAAAVLLLDREISAHVAALF